jgi:hypothetical protein
MYVYGFGQIYEERKITNKEQHPTPPLRPWSEKESMQLKILTIHV